VKRQYFAGSGRFLPFAPLLSLKGRASALFFSCVGGMPVLMGEVDVVRSLLLLSGVSLVGEYPVENTIKKALLLRVLF